jgi:orotidine-5'-phosphate decarboxylase
MQTKSPNEKFKPLRNPLIIALDVDTDTQALKLADELQDLAGGYKLGPRLVHRYGQKLSLEIAARAPLFIDCKFFDIPSTMEAAVQASFDSGASLVTVHALAGKEALQKVAMLEAMLNAQRDFRILCVTILTSWTELSFPPNFKSQPIATHVSELADLAKASGLQGVVCSPEELELLKGKGLFLVTPGIRAGSDAKGDQQRTKTPFAAMKAGASALVVGRPIIQAPDPRAAALEISLAMIEEQK